jgi:hypothetical protein
MMVAYFDEEGQPNETLTPDAAMRQADAAAEAPGSGGDEAVAGLVRAVRTLLPVVPAHPPYGNVATAVQLVRNALARVSDASPQTVDVCGGKRLQSAVADVLRLYQQEQQDPMSLMSRLRAAHDAPRAYLEGFVTEYETIVRSLGNIANALGMPPVPFRLVEGVQAILERARAVAELIKRAKEHECETFPRESCEHLSAANIVSDLAAMDPDDVVDGAGSEDGAGARPATADEHEEAIQAWVNRVEKADGFERVGSGSCDLTMSEAEWRELRDEALRLMRSDRGPGDRVHGLHFCSYSKETGTLHVHFKDVSGAMRVRVNDRLTQIRNGDEVVGFVAFRLHEPFSNAPWDAEQSMVDLVKAVTSVFDSGWLELAPDQVAGREAAIARDYNWMLRALVQLNEAVHAPEKSDATDAERRVHNMEDGSVDGPPSAEDVAEQAEATEAELRDQLEAAKSAETAIEAASDALREAGVEDFATVAFGIRKLASEMRTMANLMLLDGSGQAVAELEGVEALASIGDWVAVQQLVTKRLAELREAGQQRERPAPNPIGEPTRPPDGWHAVEEPKQPEHDGEPSIVQCNFDDPDVVPKIVGALDGLDSRVRKLEAGR